MFFWIAVLFVSAGTWRWPRGWVCVALYFSTMMATGALMKRFNPELLQARSNWKYADTKPFDKIILRVFLPLTFVLPAVAGFELRLAHRFVAPWTLYAGAVVFLAAMAIVNWALITNRFAETTVRIQSDRGHSVISSGPYRFVRHPMYVGSILMYPGTALMLGSRWAPIVGIVIAAILVVRTALEDRTLRRELAGYEEYAAVTRYRLIPGVW
jgi:protein-S-isoprenylcysteine O-methyltransferase Ste14